MLNLQSFSYPIDKRDFVLYNSIILNLSVIYVIAERGEIHMIFTERAPDIFSSAGGKIRC